MHLADLIPDGDVVVALETEELGLLILQVLAKWHPQANEIEIGTFINGAQAGYASYPRRDQIALAIREAWVWLEGQGLLFPDPRQLRGNGSCRPPLTSEALYDARGHSERPQIQDRPISGLSRS
jgi:hypothetical protein